MTVNAVCVGLISDLKNYCIFLGDGAKDKETKIHINHIKLSNSANESNEREQSRDREIEEETNRRTSHHASTNRCTNSL